MCTLAGQAPQLPQRAVTLIVRQQPFCAITVRNRCRCIRSCGLSLPFGFIPVIVAPASYLRSRLRGFAATFAAALCA